MQSLVTEQLEALRAEQLSVELDALPDVLVDTWRQPMIDPRRASWREMCEVGRAFCAAWPTATYCPRPDVFVEMCTTYLGAHSALAYRLGVGSPLRGKGARNMSLDP